MFFAPLAAFCAALLLLPLSEASCGYDACHATKPGMINVHLLPHTHDDVGWLKTVDQYYYGSRKDITGVGVQYILDSVVDALLSDENKRFIYVETAFFWRWWREQNDERKSQVRSLVDAGRLEFIGGGWCMNDEAATHYNAIVDQMTWGFRRLNDTFGSCARPKIAWQIDPFGHSKEQANLFAQMGFEGLFFGRLDYADKEKRILQKTMEMIWKGSKSLGTSSNLFTGALYNGYGPPNGFCWDVYCNDDPIMDDPRMQDYNADDIIKKFVMAAKDWAKAYATDHILMPMGEDFNYSNANSWYKNIDKLIRLVNGAHKGLNLIYSTPSCYLKSLHDTGRNWTSKSDDFFPYASDPHAYWSGYFTSRPALKDMVRKGNNLLQVCKQVAAFTSHTRQEQDSVKVEDQVTTMREAMGVLQHHDAVSGTAKQAVTFDYGQRLAAGVTACEDVVGSAMKEFITSGKKEEMKKNVAPEIKFCRGLNVTECETSEKNSQFVVHVYNPLTRPVSKFIRLPVPKSGFEVISPDGKSLTTQVIPINKKTKLIPGRKSAAAFELIFKADVPALGFKSFYVKVNAKLAKIQLSKPIKVTKKTVFGNSEVGVSVGAHGKINKIRSGKVMLNLMQTFAYYEGHTGHNAKFSDRASGAYIFRPNEQTPHVLAQKPNPTLYKGPLVQELHQEFESPCSQVTRVYTNSTDLEFDFIVGPIPITDGKGKEIITSYETGLKSEGKFVTDANGRQLLERTRNKRPTWKLNLTEPVASNYYPVNSRIGLEDPKTKLHFTVLTDRSQGGASIRDGQLELMLHRRLLFDDAFGVGEPLNEQAFGQGLVIRGKHWLQLSQGAGAAAVNHRFGAQQIFMDSWLSFSETKLSFADWKSTFNLEQSMLADNALPPNVHLLTLEEWTANEEKKFLVRFEHLFEANEDSKMSAAVQFEMKNFLNGFEVTSAREVALGANMDQKDMDRLKWNVVKGNDIEEQEEMKTEELGEAMTVKLQPMQIRSFIIDLKKN